MFPPFPSVLIVEDEPLIALDLKDEIEALGLSCLVAGTVDHALALVETSSLCFVILDCVLHGRTSQPVAAQLRARGIPFVICSGDQPDEIASAFGNGTILTKPFTTETLLQTLERLADRAAIGYRPSARMEERRETA